MPFYVTRAHPNPMGKDKARYQAPTNEKLNQEWLEFKNISSVPAKLDDVTLHHLTFDRSCSKTGEDHLMSFKGDLQPGYSIRVHTGSGTVSLAGTIYHLFAGRENYVWNNACGDRATVKRAGQINDWAYYDPHPREGVDLVRVANTNKLV
jgi:hypothetical protein